MDDERTRLLQRMPIFGAISPVVVELLVDRAATAEVAQGEAFFREGSAGTSAFVLEEGAVSIWKHWNGREYLLRHLGTGDCFGEVALLDFGRRSASVIADRDCRAIELTARDLLGVAGTHPDQFALLYMNLGRELSRRLSQADERLFRARIGESTAAEDYTFGSN